MRSVNRSTIDEPVELAGRNSIGHRETHRSILFHYVGADGIKEPDYKAYKSSGVKNALNTLFKGKCAYCESVYAHLQPMDVEHYRPKGGYIVKDKLVQPGYYWLAADWNNLLPSCIDCNREREQEIYNDSNMLVGKENKFPIADERRRAKVPGDESHEDRLLLNPCMDAPEDHLEFTLDGIIRPKLINGVESEIGDATIKVLGLMRHALVHERREVIRKIKDQMFRVEFESENIRHYPADLRFQEKRKMEIEALKDYMKDTRPYVTMAREIITPFLREKGIE